MVTSTYHPLHLKLGLKMIRNKDSTNDLDFFIIIELLYLYLDQFCGTVRSDAMAAMREMRDGGELLL